MTGSNIEAIQIVQRLLCWGGKTIMFKTEIAIRRRIGGTDLRRNAFNSIAADFINGVVTRFFGDSVMV